MSFFPNRVVLLDCMPDGEHGPVEDVIDVLNGQLIGHKHMDFRHARVSGAEAFLEHMAALLERALHGADRPLLHIECHGLAGGRGLHFPDGTTLIWAQLRVPLGALNRAAENNLFLMLASCGGAGCCELLDLNGQAPIYGFLGAQPEVEPTAVALRTRFRAFYETLFSGDPPDGNDALAAFNCVLPGGYEKYFARDAEMTLLEATAMEPPGNVTPEQFASLKRVWLLLSDHPHLEERFSDCTFDRVPAYRAMLARKGALPGLRP